MDTGTHKVLEINEPEDIDVGVTSVAISHDGKLVAAASLDSIVRIWDVATGALMERLKGHRDSVYSVAFTPDGKGLVSGSLDKTLKHWDLTALVSGAGVGVPSTIVTTKEKEGGDHDSICTQDFTGHKDYVLSVSVSNDGDWVVSGSKDRGVLFWDAKSAAAQLLLQGHKNSVISATLSPLEGCLRQGVGIEIGRASCRERVCLYV